MKKVISSTSRIVNGTVHLPSSKSISNRLLILNALYEPIEIQNLSEAEDTQILKAVLESEEEVIDVGHAGTAMRFLLAYYVAKGQSKILTGSARMKERPIGPLVDALKQIGADIEYLEKPGYPPIKINPKPLRGGKVEIDGSVSSQFISALLMIGDFFPESLEIHIRGNIVSEAYIELTREWLPTYGYHYEKLVDKDTRLTIYKLTHLGPAMSPEHFIRIEVDWSAASYWYSFVALSEAGEIMIERLRDTSVQGDAIIHKWMADLGVKTEFTDTGALLSKTTIKQDVMSFDFTNCPDLAQTIIVLCATLNIGGYFSGLETLRIKETDRIEALKAELKKFGKQLIEFENGLFKLYGEFKPSSPSIQTYNDHRMAMAFAPLAMVCGSIEIEDPDVVKKSYPNFWEDVEAII